MAKRTHCPAGHPYSGDNLRVYPSGMRRCLACEKTKHLRLKTSLERFEDKFIPEPNSGCWLWTASVWNRYGQFGVANKSHRAHRVSWQLYRGPIPAGLCVLHKCDVPTCVNPNHLFLGTQTDNVADMMKKGRHVSGNAGNHGNHARGERAGQTRLTESSVRSMRTEFNAGFKNGAALARKYEISESQARRVISGESWAWLNGH